jgi:hypothetical protein
MPPFWLSQHTTSLNHRNRVAPSATLTEETDSDRATTLKMPKCRVTPSCVPLGIRRPSPDDAAEWWLRWVTGRPPLRCVVFQLRRNPRLDPELIIRARGTARQPAACPNSGQIAEFSLFMHVLFNLHPLRVPATHAKPHLNLLRRAPEHEKFERQP